MKAIAMHNHAVELRRPTPVNISRPAIKRQELNKFVFVVPSPNGGMMIHDDDDVDDGARRLK